MADIFRVERDYNAKLKEIEELERTGHEHIRTGGSELIASGRSKLDRADQLRQSSAKVQKVRLEKLKRALAQFQTGLLPGMGGDNSVILENLRNKNTQ
jgi:hypothetical protein